MARLKLDFSRGTRQNRWRTALWMLGALACLHALLWRIELEQRRDHSIAQLNEKSRRLVHREHAAPPPPVLGAIFTEMHSPWTTILDSVQKIKRPGVVLLALEPDPNDVHRVHIRGTSARPEDVLDLINSLSDDHFWSSVQLISQMNADTAVTSPIANQQMMPTLPGLPQASVSFSLIAEWGQL